jgi:acyl-CoA synthetase (AMP-forming)/AMP-acid ligase II
MGSGMGTPAPLLAWLDKPSAERGIHFAGAGDDWDFWSYPRLADLTRRVGDGLRSAGLRSGSVVAVIQHSSPEFVASFFGAMAAGCTPAPIAPPMAFQDASAYAAHVLTLLRTVRAAAVLMDRDLRADLTPLAERTDVGLIATVDEVTAGAAPADAAAPADIALVQFSSGSSGRPRGIRVPAGAIEANVHAIRGWLAMTPDDVTTSWLPVHHDMGLIGCLLAPVVNRSDIRLLRPEQFIHAPLRYLRCFGSSRAGLTAMPNFGLDYIARRVRPEQLAGLDFSRWRAVIVGAERVDARAVEAFHRLLSPYGFDHRAILPAYGLAESTLAVTGLGAGQGWTARSVDPDSLRPGLAVRERGDGGQRLVGCGWPLGDASVRIHDESGAAVPPGTLGEIVVRGPSVCQGYVGVQAAAPSSFTPDGALRTGDAGFLDEDGQLFVVGRLGDSLKVRGRTVFAEDLETALESAGVPTRRSAVLLGERGAVPTAVVVFERATDDWQFSARRLLPPRIGDAELVLVDAPRGSILRTSSGKPQRRVMWARFVAGEIGAEQVPVVANSKRNGRDNV